MKNTFQFSLIFILFSILFSAQSNQLKIDSIVQAELNKFPDVGLVIGVYQDAKTDYYSYGNVAENSRQKMDSATIFEIGSATKTFTALLLAQEIAKGNIKQFDFIDKFIPTSTKLKSDLKNKILVTDLATHQSGLPNLSGDRYFSELMKKDPSNPFRFVDENYILNVLKSTDHLTDYKQYQYNNYAYALLGSILEKESEIPFEKMIQKRILNPLNMTSTYFDLPYNKNVAGLYNQQGELQKAMVLNKVNPAGGLKSNAVDLLKYLKAFLNNGDFKDEKEIIEKTYYKDSKRKIGLGWEIGENFLEKDGDTFGNSSLIRYSTKNKIAIVILSNHQNGQLVRDLMNNIYATLAL